MLRCKNDKLEK